MATLKVPFEGTNVIAQGEGPPRDNGSTLAQRKSLHTVRMSAQPVPDVKPEWLENGRLKWVPQEPPDEPPAEEPAAEGHMMGGGNGTAQAGQPYDALTQQIQELKQTVNYLAQMQGGQAQQPRGPQPPDPTEYDFYEPKQVQEFHRLNNEYIQATVQQSVQAALDPHRDTMQSAEDARQYNRVLSRNPNDPNFQPIMERALNLVASTNRKFSIEEAYDLVASSQITSPHQMAQTAQQTAAKPAQRTLTAQEAAQKAAQAQSLPPRNGVSGAGEPGLPSSLQNVGALGRIMLHNQQTGRARFPA